MFEQTVLFQPRERVEHNHDNLHNVSVADLVYPLSSSGAFRKMEGTFSHFLTMDERFLWETQIRSDNEIRAPKCEDKYVLHVLQPVGTTYKCGVFRIYMYIYKILFSSVFALNLLSLSTASFALVR